jgi:DNA replication protein
MKEFSGFPARTKYTPIPNMFFSTVLPQIDDLSELKVTLYILWVVYLKKGYPRFVTYRELLSDPVLMKGLVNNGSPSQLLQHGLDLAVRRGTLLQLTVERDGEVDRLYFINSEADRRAVDKIKSGELKIGELAIREPYSMTQERPNIFTLYEQNIGMLSPIIAEELTDAEKTFPDSWVRDAFKEAVELNKRNWRYILRILETWSAEGRDDGEHRRYTKAESDPEEYRRRYGHFLKK